MLRRTSITTRGFTGLHKSRTRPQLFSRERASSIAVKACWSLPQLRLDPPDPSTLSFQRRRFGPNQAAHAPRHSPSAKKILLVDIAFFSDGSKVGFCQFVERGAGERRWKMPSYLWRSFCFAKRVRGEHRWNTATTPSCKFVRHLAEG